MANYNAEREALNAIVHICEQQQEKNYITMTKFFDDLFTVFHNLNKETHGPEIVESTYTGLHLTEIYTEEDFYKMLDQFRDYKLIHAKYALKIINDALKKHKEYSNIERCNLNESTLNEVVIVGDLHGSFRDLNHIIHKYDIPGKRYVFIFNGDYVDRGPQQCEVLLTLLYAYLLYPTKVFINRGNHEDVRLNLSKHFTPNFSDDCKQKYKQHAYTVFKLAHELFKYLPIATVLTNKAGFKCFIVHGGVSDAVDLNFVKSDQLKRYEFNSITRSKNDEKSVDHFCDLMWSDPMNRNGCLPNSKRGVGALFGEDVSEEFCKKNHLTTIVRSHQVRDDGWSKDHDYCYTVFSCSNYCHGTNKAAVLLLGQNDLTFRVHSFVTEEQDENLFQKQKDFLLLTFKIFLDTHSNKLMKLFRKADPENKGFYLKRKNSFKKIKLNKNLGWIKVKDWASIISNYLADQNIKLKEKHLIVLKDYLLPCDGKTDMANYESMFERSINSAKNSYNILDDIFRLIDINHDGTITKSEGNKIIKYVNTTLGTSYSDEFLIEMDKNKDGIIDINEFKQAFTEAFHLKKLNSG